MTKKTVQPEPLLTGVDDLVELPRSIEPEALVVNEPDPLDTWVEAWAKTQALATVVDRLKTELKARGLHDPALVGPHHLGDLNAAIRAALRLDAHALLTAAQNARGEK